MGHERAARLPSEPPGVAVVAGIRPAAHSANPAVRATWGALGWARRWPLVRVSARVGAGRSRRSARRRRTVRLGCQTWLKCCRCRYCCCRENAEPSWARWAAAARAAKGTCLPGAAVAAMARLADYFIVVGYDHEKPGKGVGRAPPPGLPAPVPPRLLSSGLWASQPGGGEGRAGPRRSRRSVSGLRGWAEPRGGREGPARGEGEGRKRGRGRARGGPGRPSWASWGRVWVLRPSLCRRPGTRGSALVPAGLIQDLRAGRAGANCVRFLGDKLLPSILSE